jgi:hypothetical protein
VSDPTTQTWGTEEDRKATRRRVVREYRRRKSEGKTKRQTTPAEREQLCRQASELRGQGLTWKQVGEQMGLSADNARNYGTPGRHAAVRGYMQTRAKRMQIRCACGGIASGRGTRCIACLNAVRLVVPKERVRPLLQAEVPVEWRSQYGKRAVEALAERCHVDQTTIWRILTDSGVYAKRQITFRVLDKILCGLGLVHLWYVPPEQGGFADIYNEAPRTAEAEPGGQLEEAA